MSDMEQSAQPQEVPPSPDSTKEQTQLGPVTATQRMNSLDILRGFALIGILLMNIEWFGRSVHTLGVHDPSLSGLDHAFGWLVRCFVEGKFYKLFSLLFGMGFAVMLSRAMEAGRPFGAWFSRRMFWLFVIGAIHSVFIWVGDILHDYAFCGMLLLGYVCLIRTEKFQRYNNPRSGIKLAIWWISIPALFALIAGIGFSLFNDSEDWAQQSKEAHYVRSLVNELETELAAGSTSSEKQTQADGVETADVSGEEVVIDGEENEEDIDPFNLTPEQEAQETFESEQEASEEEAAEIKALSTGTYVEATQWRADYSLFALAITPFFSLMMLMPVFLLGYWLVISGVMREPEAHVGLFRTLIWAGLPAGLLMTVAGLLVSQHPSVEQEMAVLAAGGSIFNFGQYFMAAGYFGLIMNMLQSEKWNKRLSVLAPMGRMALTNYIMHSVILTSVFYGYAGGMYGEISRAPQMLIVVAIFAVQIPLSNWWLNRYRFGPLEWLWRSLTYKEWQAFKIA